MGSAQRLAPSPPLGILAAGGALALFGSRKMPERANLIINRDPYPLPALTKDTPYLRSVQVAGRGERRERSRRTRCWANFPIIVTLWIKQISVVILINKFITVKFDFYAITREIIEIIMSFRRE
jgi:hypothetical protein